MLIFPLICKYHKWFLVTFSSDLYFKTTNRWRQSHSVHSPLCGLRAAFPQLSDKYQKHILQRLYIIMQPLCVASSNAQQPALFTVGSYCCVTLFVICKWDLHYMANWEEPHAHTHAWNMNRHACSWNMSIHFVTQVALQFRRGFRANKLPYKLLHMLLY